MSNNSGPIETQALDAVGQDEPGERRDASGPMKVVHEGSMKAEALKVTLSPAEELLIAQKKFIAAQTEYIHTQELPIFVRAQTAYAIALTEALRSANVGRLATFQEEYIRVLTAGLESLGLI